MNVTRSIAKVRVSRRPAMHLRVDRIRVGGALEEAQTNNGWLIFHDHDVDGEPGSHACALAFTNPALEVASGRQTPILNSGEVSLCAGI
jgi:hypothetical protein